MRKTRSTMAYKRGAVVLLPFPFTDQSGVKRRPALVLSASRYNRQRGDLIVAPITSNLATRQAEDIALAAGDTAGLLKPSVVKGVLGTVEATLVIRTIGDLAADDLAAVERSFVNILGLPPTTV